MSSEPVGDADEPQQLQRPLPGPGAPRAGGPAGAGARRRTLVLWWASAPTRTFSSAVISGNRRMFWNVRATPSLVIGVALAARADRAPSKRTCRSVGRYTPVTTLKTVVLPAPLGPIRPKISPCSDVQADVVERDHPAEAHGDAGRAGGGAQPRSPASTKPGSLVPSSRACSRGRRLGLDRCGRRASRRRRASRHRPPPAGQQALRAGRSS